MVLQQKKKSKKPGSGPVCELPAPGARPALPGEGSLRPNAAVFATYTEEMRACRSSHLLTGAGRRWSRRGQPLPRGGAATFFQPAQTLPACGPDNSTGGSLSDLPAAAARRLRPRPHHRGLPPRRPLRRGPPHPVQEGGLPPLAAPQPSVAALPSPGPVMADWSCSPSNPLCMA